MEDVDSGGSFTCVGADLYGKSLYLLLDFTMNLKFLQKNIKSIKRHPRNKYAWLVPEIAKKSLWLLSSRRKEWKEAEAWPPNVCQAKGRSVKIQLFRAMKCPLMTCFYKSIKIEIADSYNDNCETK